MKSSDFRSLVSSGKLKYRKGKYTTDENLGEITIRKSESRQEAVAKGFRSAFEMRVFSVLQGFEYEPFKLKYKKKSRKKYFCEDCGSSHVLEEATYTPDFVKGNIIIETKGRFSPADQKKMLAVIRDNPEYVVVMVFQDLGAKTNVGTVVDWCKKHNVLYTNEKNLNLFLKTL